MRYNTTVRDLLDDMAINEFEAIQTAGSILLELYHFNEDESKKIPEADLHRLELALLSAERNDNVTQFTEKQTMETGNARPGQQLPTADPNGAAQPQGDVHKSERHSESSFPQEEGETLGTP